MQRGARSGPVLVVLTALLITAYVARPQRGDSRDVVPVFGYRVVKVYPHDPEAFTQGLVYADGFLYEGTGLNGRSSIRKVKLETGDVVQSREIDAEHFGEGIAVFQSRLIQLTWQSHRGFVYDAATFSPQRTFQYSGEGWGLTHDGARLIMSDGTATLRFWNPETFAEEGRVTVREDDRPIERLNELEFVRGEIYANVWQTDRIVRIDRASGRVKGWIDLSGLLAESERRSADVLNGIAWDKTGDRLFVTGKLWPKLFEIALVPSG